MDKLLLNLHNKNIIKIKNITFKNGYISPIYFDFNELFKNKILLNEFLQNLQLFINDNFALNLIDAKNEISKYFCLLLSYKYNFIYNIEKNSESEKEQLFIKDTYGIKKSNNNYKNVLFLIKYSVKKNVENNHKFFLDTIYILNTLYTSNILTYEKYISLFIVLDFEKNNKIITNFANSKKCRIIFDTQIIDKLDIKDFIKTIDFIAPHISIIKINLKLYESHIKSIIKLLIHHKIYVLDYLDFEMIKKLEIMYNDQNLKSIDYVFNLINITNLLQNKNIYYSSFIMDDVNIKEFENIKLKIFNYFKQEKKVIGFITSQDSYYFEDKLKLGYFQNGDNLEKKILIDKYDFLLTQNFNNIINLKQLVNNLLNIQ